MLTDLRLAVRALANRPAFFAVCVFTLALGVASVSAIFSVVNGTLLKPLPYPDAERIVRISRVQGNWSGPISMPVMEDWRDGTAGTLSSLGGFAERTATLTGDGEAERILAYGVTADFWNALSLAPLHGRYFNAEEDEAGEFVVVLSHALWSRRYGADPGIIGRDIQLNGRAYRVIGVTPESFRYPADTQAYIPIGRDPNSMTRGSNFLFAVGRLAPGATVEQLDAALSTVNSRLSEEFPNENAGLGARITVLPELLTGRVRQPLVIMLAAATMVLLIACANLASLIVARGARREREYAVRAALGASRLRLMRASFSEALVIAVAGGLAGIALAAAAVPSLMALAPGLMPSHSQPEVDLIAVLVSLSVTVATVMMFAAWPAWRAAACAQAKALKDEGRAGAGVAKARARAVLVVAEVALSLTLLAGAGLLLESMRQLSMVNLGLEPQGVLTASFVADDVTPVPGESIAEGYNRLVERTAPQVERIRERLAALPGVQQVGITDALPLSGVNNISSNLTIVGREVVDGQPGPGATWRFISPDFHTALGIPMVAGRALDDTDFRIGDVPRAVLVNETFVRRYLADVDPIGQRVQFFDGGEKTIVGIIADTSGLGIEREPITEVYMHHGFTPIRQFYVALKVQGDPMAYAETLRRAIAEVEPSVPVLAVRSMDQVIGSTTVLRAFNLTLMSVFSAIALVLAAVGLYGVLADSVNQRRREIGVRLSLGAAPGAIRTMVLSQGVKVIALGVVIGLAAALMLARFMASQLFGITPWDPAVFGFVVLVLSLVGIVAVAVPAREASRIAPMEALRYE